MYGAGQKKIDPPASELCEAESEKAGESRRMDPGCRIIFFAQANKLPFAKGFAMNFNFFDWMRDGVKRSVLLGVSDAVEQMGQPHDEETAKEKILGFLQGDESTGRVSKRLPTSTSGQKKLGRSISDIHPTKSS